MCDSEVMGPYVLLHTMEREKTAVIRQEEWSILPVLCYLSSGLGTFITNRC